MKKYTEANRGGMFVLSDDEVKQIEQIAGTCCCGHVICGFIVTDLLRFMINSELPRIWMRNRQGNS